MTKKIDDFPEKIGNYKIIDKLGMGGMGVIYKALQEPISRVVALKVLSPRFIQDQESSLRFESEAKAISMLQHQNIVQLYEYAEEQGYRYFTMQFIDGQNLAQKIYRKKVMSLTDIVNYSKQICRGLRYAHGLRVIHRDIKPQNVLIDKNNVARLSDFGIAKLVTDNDITMTGVTVGTPEYMSPEQASGQDLTIQTDIYSLGIIIYEMLTKRPPFTADNPVAVAYKQVHEIPLPPSALRKDTPKRLELIVLKALKKDTRERYQSVDELLDNLDSVDIDEKVEKPTVRFKMKGQKTPHTERRGEYTEKRITDRRNSGRHTEYPGLPTLSNMKKISYWKSVLESQWLSLMLIALLYALYLFDKYN